MTPPAAVDEADPSLRRDNGPVVTPVLAFEDFAECFRYHYPRLVRALVLAGASHGTAEEIAQESFARTLGHWRRVRGGTNPAGYVFRVAFRLLRGRGMLPTSPLDDEVAAPVSVADAAAAKVDLDRVLARMPPRRRACVVLCWLLEAPTAEAAETLGISAGTVRKQLELARGQLDQSSWARR